MTSKATILIADDSEVSRDYMANILRSSGYHVIQAIDGGSALKVVHEHAITLAIIDHYMAPHGGFEFARYVRDNNLKLPMIMVTNEESSDLLIETTRFGIGRYLKKPVDPKRLVETVKRSLREVEEKAPDLSGKIGSSQIASNTYKPEDIMRRVIELAHKNAQSRAGGPFGAMVADADGRILGQGVNSVTSRSDPVAHAEVMAIRQATERLNQTHLKGCVLYCSSEPTTIGRALIESVAIEKVYYALARDDLKAFLSPKKPTQVPESQQIGRDEAMAMITAWAKLKDAVED
jgi:guanine deaminase